ncbi:MAG: DUF655 domain-containing protein [archaeon]
MNEDNALVLDYLAKGKSTGFKSEPLAQLVGTKYFTLLEVKPKETLSLLEKVYIGKDERDKIEFIKKRITFDELTSTASAELDKAIEKIILDDKQRFLDFYNNSRSVSVRRHQLELLPGVGKKHMLDMLKQREIKPFESFEDIEKRVKLMPNPLQAIVKRVVLELEAETDIKYYLFARPPQKPRTF